MSEKIELDLEQYMNESVHLGCSVPRRVKEWMMKEAKARRMSVSHFIREAAYQYVNNSEQENNNENNNA